LCRDQSVIDAEMELDEDAVRRRPREGLAMRNNCGVMLIARVSDERLECWRLQHNLHRRVALAHERPELPRVDQPALMAIFFVFA
jgi:hypothetical protein